MGHRVDLYSFTPSERQALVNLILQYLTDAVVAAHVAIIHNDVHIFTGHRTYIEQLEAFLASQGAQQFVPLPKWDPATPIPPEFSVVKPRDDGTPRPPLQNLNPNRPMPPQFASPAACVIADGDALGNAVNPWHGGVHVAVGGTMSQFTIASAAPIFWCWHAFIDEIYYDWQRCGERGNLLHLSGVTSDGRLWHTIRREDGTWFPFGDVEGEAGDRGTIVDVDLQNVGAEIHLCAVNSLGNLWHTIRRQDGTWFDFGDVKQQAGDRGPFGHVSIGECGGELHLSAATVENPECGQIRVDISQRRAHIEALNLSKDGLDPRNLGDRQLINEINQIISAVRGEIADLEQRAQQLGCSPSSNLWHTIRQEDGTWFQFGDVEGQAGERGYFAAVSVDGVFIQT